MILVEVETVGVKENGTKARFKTPDPSAQAPIFHGVSASTGRDLDVIDLDSTDLIEKSELTLCPIVGGEATCVLP